MIPESLPPAAQLKLDLMLEGIRYSEALGQAAQHALPNYVPYRFQPGENDPTGRGMAAIPYLLATRNDTHVRIKGNSASPWVVSGDRDGGYSLARDGAPSIAIEFEPLPRWMSRTGEGGATLAEAGVTLHGDMAVVNIAPGCQYFLTDRERGQSMRCTFCSYGAPDSRSRAFGQDMDSVSLPPETYRHMREALAAAIGESGINHIYLVGGSMTDWGQEGIRFIELAREVQKTVDGRIPVSCGSGALPPESLRRLHDEDLVQNICFNLEVWSEPLFARVCPGKNSFVGYQRWIEALEGAVSLWGRERVYSAMVAGIELEPEFAMSWESAADLALEGAADLCSRGIIPIYSLYWPLGGRERAEYTADLLAYFGKLNLGYRDIRNASGLKIWDGFMCHRCAYMQLECDIDRAATAQETGR